VVMIRGGRVKDLPGCPLRILSAACLIRQGVENRKQRRSKIGAKRPKKARGSMSRRHAGRKAQKSCPDAEIRVTSF